MVIDMGLISLATTHRGRIFLLAAACVLAAMMIAVNAPAVRADLPSSAQFFTSTDSGVVKVFANGTVQPLTGVSSGYSLELLDGKLYVNQQHSRIRVYTADGVYVKNISVPSGVQYLTFVVLPDERIAFLDNDDDKVYFVSPSGTLLATVNLTAEPNTSLQNIDGVVVNNALIVSEDGDNNVMRIDLNTYQITVFKNLSQIQPWIGHITYSNGYYYVCGPRSVYRFTESSNATEVANLPVGNIVGIVVINDRAYAAVNSDGRIYEINLQNGNYTVFAEGLDYPHDLETTVAENPAASGVDPMWYVIAAVAAVAIAAAAFAFLRRR